MGSRMLPFSTPLNTFIHAEAYSSISTLCFCSDIRLLIQFNTSPVILQLVSLFVNQPVVWYRFKHIFKIDINNINFILMTSVQSSITLSIALIQGCCPSFNESKLLSTYHVITLKMFYMFITD
jgi:presenilin-like A22 family membrane protease